MSLVNVVKPPTSTVRFVFVEVLERGKIMTGIYKFTNKINGKSYIGQSTNIRKRYKAHKNKSSEHSLFHEAIKEFGFENFDFSVIETCSSECLNEKEVFYIKEYNTLFPNGYNVSVGGYYGHPVGLSCVGDVSSIIYFLKNTNMSNIEIGEMFNVSDQTISDINNGRIWADDSLNYPIRDRKIIEKRHCINCGKELYKYSKNDLCQKCLSKKSRKEVPVSKEELLNLITTTSFLQIGKMFSVSDNAIRKWCKKYNLPFKYKDIKLLKQSLGQV